LNFFVVTAVFVLIAVLLGLLSAWQRKVEESESARVASEIRAAKERGTDKPLNQHPQIDAQACIGCGSCVAVCPEDGVLGLVDGIAHVIHGVRCIGHGLCADACPVAAIQVGLGELAKRPDLPVLTQRLESVSARGIYLAGELGGFALIRVAVQQGVRAMEAVARDLAAHRTKASGAAADVLIVGAGPAGFAATLKAVECGLSYVTIDQEDLGGTVRKYPRKKLTLTGQLSLPLHGLVKRTEYLKEELIAFWQKLAADHALELRTGVKLSGIERRGGVFVADTTAGPIAARRVILAVGRRGSPRKLGVPGEEKEKVLYQLVDAATHTNEHVLIVGGGDSAVEAATALANQTGNTVTLSYRKGGFFRLKARNEERIESYRADGRLQVVFNSNVESIEDDAATLLVAENGAERRLRLENNYTFIFAGGEPPYALLKKIGVQMNGDLQAAAGDGASAAREPAEAMA
jgi:thioredoxin reductase